MSAPVIRCAGPDDAERLTEIAHASKRHWGYSDELISLWRDDLTVTRDFVASHDVACATHDGDIVGFYALSNEESTYELEHMWVDPARIGRGIGAALFRHAVQTVRSQGGTTLRIASDPNAEGFYTRMGAQPAGHVPSAPEGRTLPLLTFAIGR